MRLPTEEHMIADFNAGMSVAEAGVLYSTLHVFANVSPNVHCVWMHSFFEQ